MAIQSINIKDLFKEELNRGLNVLGLGRETVEYMELEESEVDAIERCVKMGVRILEKVSPTAAKIFEEHLSIFLKFGGIAKAHFPESKPIKFPSEPGCIGVNLLFPQAIKYAATPSASVPCYTDFKTNKWEIDLTEGTRAYLLGSDTAYYKASPQTAKHELIVICQNGIIEIGSTPKLGQFRVLSEIQQKYGIWTPHPLVDVSVEPNKQVFIYPTLGVLPVYHDLGVKLYAMPYYSGTAYIRLLGIVFYEHDLFPDVTWIT